MFGLSRISAHLRTAAPVRHMAAAAGGVTATFKTSMGSFKAEL